MQAAQNMLDTATRRVTKCAALCGLWESLGLL